MVHCNAELLLSDNNGTNMPREFVARWSTMVVEYDNWKDDLTFLAERHIWDTGYWDTWDSVLSDCLVMWKGHRYTLHLDGDLFMVPYEGEVTWVPNLTKEPDDMHAWFLNQVDRDVHDGEYVWRE
jgi:hypothetical protein